MDRVEPPSSEQLGTVGERCSNRNIVLNVWAVQIKKCVNYITYKCSWALKLKSVSRTFN